MTAPIRVDHHQFYIRDAPPLSPELIKRAFPRPGTLAGATDGLVIIMAGIECGPATLTVETDWTKPPLRDDWSDAVELSFTASIGDARVRCWDGSTPAEFPVVSFVGVGRYGLRVFANGRQLCPDLAVSESVENYLIQVWPLVRRLGLQ